VDEVGFKKMSSII